MTITSEWLRDQAAAYTRAADRAARPVTGPPVDTRCVRCDHPLLVVDLPGGRERRGRWGGCPRCGWQTRHIPSWAHPPPRPS